jgi:hypothetical protein
VYQSQNCEVGTHPIYSRQANGLNDASLFPPARGTAATFHHAEFNKHQKNARKMPFPHQDRLNAGSPSYPPWASHICQHVAHGVPDLVQLHVLPYSGMWAGHEPPLQSGRLGSGQRFVRAGPHSPAAAAFALRRLLLCPQRAAPGQVQILKAQPCRYCVMNSVSRLLPLYLSDNNI